MLQLLLRKADAAHPVQFHERAEHLLASLTSFLKKSVAMLPLVCFLELTLPDMSGLEVLQWIRSQPTFDAISVVMLARSEDPASIKQAAAFGAQCYLAKYPQPSTLRSVLAEAVELSVSGKPARHWFGIRENLILRWGHSFETASG